MNKAIGFMVSLIFVPGAGIFLLGLFLLYIGLWILEKGERLYEKIGG